LARFFQVSMKLRRLFGRSPTMCLFVDALRAGHVVSCVFSGGFLRSDKSSAQNGRKISPIETQIERCQVSNGSRIKVNFCKSLERAMGIEPTSEAWEASILPLYDARSGFFALF
jgi:hypothetical protein